MLKVAALFTILATLARAGWKETYAPEENAPCYVDGQDGTVKGTLCVINGLGLGKRLLGDGLLGGLGGLGLGGDKISKAYNWREGDRCDVGGRYGYVKDTLCVIADVNVKRQNHPYGFGWFHPGPFASGDRCWTGTQEGVIQDSLCIAISLGSDPYFNNGWFAQPYYGYGHSFGWYHPGPFVEGDRCWQNNKEGLVRDALCIDLGVNLGLGDLGLDDLGLGGLGLAKRSYGPDYWYEPYFAPEYNFGWFHEGPFSEGDRCWTGGRYGNIANSLCVLADIDIKTKRDLLSGGGLNGLLGKHDYRQGDRCFKNNNWGLWRGRDCDTTLDLDLILNGRSLFGDGDKCWHQGQWGTWKGNSCDFTADIETLIDIKKRDASFVGQRFRDDPWLGRGIPCMKNGREGILRDTICIVANIELNVKRQEDLEQFAEETADSQDFAGSFEDATEDAVLEADNVQESTYENAPEGGLTSGWESYGGYGSDVGPDNYGPGYGRKRFLSYASGDNADHTVAKTVNKLLSDIKTRGLIKGAEAGQPSVYVTSAPPKGLTGDLGLDKLLKTRELLGSEGFRIDDLVKTLGPERRKSAMRSRQVGGLGKGNLLGGLLGGKKTQNNGEGATLAAPARTREGSGDLLVGLLGGGGGLL